MDTTTGNAFCWHTTINNTVELGYNVVKGTEYFVVNECYYN